MTRLDLRTFAQIGFHAAKGQFPLAQLRHLRAAGVSVQSIETLATRHRLKPIFAYLLSEVNWDTALPKPAYYVARHLHMRQQLLELDRALQNAGTRVILLKGAIQIFRPIYPRPGLRQMADLDLWVSTPQALQVFAKLGYITVDPVDEFPTTLELKIGEHHLAPIGREGDAARVEPHVLCVPPAYVSFLGSVEANAIAAPGAVSLLMPSRVDQIVITLIHALRADRNSMHGGLFLRSFIELELLYEGLEASERIALERAMSTKTNARLWDDWRVVADWALRGDNRARWRSVRAARLIAEIELRHLGSSGTMIAASLNLLADMTRPHFWKHARPQKFFGKLFDRAFWRRLTASFRA